MKIEKEVGGGGGVGSGRGGGEGLVGSKVGCTEGCGVCKPRIEDIVKCT